MKGGPWIKSFGFSNSLCARATRAITNHAPIGEYQLCFFPREEFSCPCGYYIQSKQDITSFTTVEDSTRAGIWEEKLSSNSYPFWNTT